jgi:predicted transcriptional regulator
MCAVVDVGILSTTMGRSRDSIYKYAQNLELKGMITRTQSKDGGGNFSNMIYTLHHKL